jgi:hypothetical protein
MAPQVTHQFFSWKIGVFSVARENALPASSGQTSCLSNHMGQKLPNWLLRQPYFPDPNSPKEDPARRLFNPMEYHDPRVASAAPELKQQ